MFENRELYEWYLMDTFSSFFFCCHSNHLFGAKIADNCLMTQISSFTLETPMMLWVPMLSRIGPKKPSSYIHNTLLKSDVTHRDHVVHCHGSQECWFTLCQFCCQFYSRRHSLRITLKSTTLVHMPSRYAWTRKSWQWSEWPLDFNSVLLPRVAARFWPRN